MKIIAKLKSLTFELMSKITFLIVNINEFHATVQLLFVHVSNIVIKIKETEGHLHSPYFETTMLKIQINDSLKNIQILK